MNNKIKLVLLNVGSFSPVTIAHLRMFELAKDYLESTGKYEVISAIISPVGNSYVKKGLIDSKMRIDMIRLALKENNWVRLDTWESEQPQWPFTCDALDHHKKELDLKYDSKVHLMLLSGADLVESFNVPNLWSDEHVEKICSYYGIAIINRHGSSLEKSIDDNPITRKYKTNFHIINDPIIHNISSTKIRALIAKNQSIKYLVTPEVEDYIQKNKLWK